MLKKLTLMAFACAVIFAAAGSRAAFAAKVPDSFLSTKDPVWEKTFSRPVSGEFRGIGLNEFLRAVSRETGVRFILDLKGVKAEDIPLVTVSLNSVPLKEVLYFASTEYALSFKWNYPGTGRKGVPEAITVYSAAKERKKLVRQTWISLFIVCLLIYIMVVVIFRKKPRIEKTFDADEVKRLSEEELILKVFSEKQNDFIFQILALDRLSRSDSAGAVNTLVNSLKNPDPLIRKVAFSKLKIKYGLADIITDFDNITDEQMEAVRSLVLK